MLATRAGIRRFPRTAVCLVEDKQTGDVVQVYGGILP